MKEFDKPPKLRLPAAKPAAPRELERRRRVVARILELRRKIGSTGIPAAQLVNEARDERGS